MRGLQDPPPPGPWALEAPASVLKGSSLGPGSLAHLYEGQLCRHSLGTGPTQPARSEVSPRSVQGSAKLLPLCGHLAVPGGLTAESCPQSRPGSPGKLFAVP